MNLPTSFSNAVPLRCTRLKALHISRARAVEWLALGAIMALAVALRFYNLDALGEANHYYTAAVQAMLQSWHNFFFAAAEPGGSVTVDKPPVGLWFQVVSAYFFGVNGFGVLLPQLLAGVLSVILVYHLIRCTFGPLPGLVAALALTITPVAVAPDRNNTMESTLILTLLLAAAATLWFQYRTAASFVQSVAWLHGVLTLFGLGLLALLASIRFRRVAVIGLVCLLAALMVTPGI